MAKSEFDPDKDKCVKALGVIDGDVGKGIEVKLMSYDGGEIKLALTRFYTKKNGDKGYSPIGRMTLDEVAELKKLLEPLDQNWISVNEK